MQVFSNWYDLRSLHTEYNILICVFFVFVILKNVHMQKPYTLHINSSVVKKFTKHEMESCEDGFVVLCLEWTQYSLFKREKERYWVHPIQ